MVDITVSRQEAVERAASLVDQGEYILGTGNYRPSQDADGNAVDLPFTQREGAGPSGCDCAGFAVCWCYKIVRHQPGFNAGAWATVSDDINVDSVIEDARHGHAGTPPVRELMSPTAGSGRSARFRSRLRSRC